jgi:hypothetical protein
VWWTSVDGGYHFWDGDEDSNTHVEDDCTLLHFRQHSITDVEVRRKRCWRRVLDEKIVVPAEEVKMYDEDGISTGKMHYSRGVATYVPFAAATQELTNPHADCFSEQPTPLLSNCTTEMEVTNLLPGCIGSGEPSQTLVPTTSRQFSSGATPITPGESGETPQASVHRTSEHFSCRETDSYQDATTSATRVADHIHLSPLDAPSSSLATSICKLLPDDIPESINEFDRLRVQLKKIAKNRTSDTSKKRMTARYNKLAEDIGRKCREN